MQLYTSAPGDFQSANIVAPFPSLLLRVQPIFFTVFGIAACHNLFFLVLPLQMKAAGVDTGAIGVAMSFYAVGAVLSGLFGAVVVAYLRNIRAFSLMAAMIIIVAVGHSFFQEVWFTGLLRLVAGFCLITSFTTLESWLNVLSDRTNRGRIFSLYQVCAAIGGGSAAFVVGAFELTDPRIFGVISVCLCTSIIVMSFNNLPLPEVSKHISAMSLKSLWRCSPSGTLSCFCGGLIATVSVSLITLYTLERQITGLSLPLILSSFVLGGLLTQYPVGWLADRFDKHLVAAGVMALAAAANFLIIVDSLVGLPQPLLVFLFLVSGGAGAALPPLAVTQVFDHLDPKDAVRATGSLQAILGVGGVIGPAIAGYLMEAFSAIAMYYYLLAVHILVMLFLLASRFFVRKEPVPSSVSFQLATQPIALGVSSIDPRFEYSPTNLVHPELKLLLLTLKDSPQEPALLIKTALVNSLLQPTDIALYLVLALPKRADELMAALVEIYPDQRLAIAKSLQELFTLRKQRINSLIEAGLCHGASDSEQATIMAMIEQVVS